MTDKMQLLYVEDDPDIRSIAELALEDEYQLTLCENGEVALQLAESLHPELILMDVMMPGLNGPDTLMRLRDFSHLKQTPVIFMTAKVQPKEVQSYLELGAIGVINKPFDPLGLPEQIRLIVAQSDSAK